MQAQAKATSGPDPAPPRLRPLRGAGELSPQEFVDALELPPEGCAPADRPYLVLNMISTADGRASIGGRSGPLGNVADRRLFHALRGAVDAVLVGAGTVRAERYGPLVRDQDTRRRRRERGLSDEPLACVVSGRMALPPDIPLLASSSSRVAVITAAAASLPATAARVEYIRAGREGRLDLRAAMGELHERFAVDTLLCEGGPHLNAHLLEAGLVDELFLALAPKLAGGDETSGEALRIIAGPELPAPAELSLLDAAESESYLFLRYGVCASLAGRVTRETISSSSLAR